ncbi:superoxide dismutase [Phytopseudomonas dryadis]|uniref:Superoxide dismutase n=1 Tax=Phytopseudomonas dryadis TaxID=2487520 RepID=A0A4Q9R5B7_9GAMM|nr:superoxide dismutase [Pseudomonas dryadis]TBU94627.1 superoxide dismutase [Pseudomonas dryadis]
MKYLVLLTPSAGSTLEDITPHMAAEIKAVWASYSKGSIREFYFSPNPPTVTLIYELANEATLHAELDLLPMIKEGLLDHQVVALGPFVQLQTLFDKRLVGSA